MRSRIVENTRSSCAESGRSASALPECASDEIGASELFSSRAMTRINFFQTTTS